MKQNSPREWTGSTRFRKTWGTFYDHHRAPVEAVEILDLRHTLHHVKRKNLNDLREAPEACHWFMLECRRSLLAGWYRERPRAKSAGSSAISATHRSSPSRVWYVWSAGMMCSTGWVTPEASGMGSEQASSRTVHTLPAGAKIPNVRRVSTPKSVRLREQIRDVDDRADWVYLGDKVTTHQIDLTSHVLKKAQSAK